jgi:hypothetical protein
MLRIPHCLDNRLTDGGKAVNPMHRPHFTPQKHYYFYVSGTHFRSRLSELQGLVRLEGLRKLRKYIHFIGYRTRDLPACGVVTQQLCCRMPRFNGRKFKKLFL